MKKMFLIMMVPLFIQCEKETTTNFQLNGEWLVLENALLEGEEVTTSVSLDGSESQYKFDQATLRVEITNDGEVEIYGYSYHEESTLLQINNSLTYEVEWITISQLYLHHHYSGHHWRYYLIKK